MPRFLPSLIGSSLLASVAFVAALAFAAQPGKRKPDPERGHDLFNQSCWPCHGKEARGDGPAAAALSVPVPALRGHFTQETIPDEVNVTLNGKGPMPGFAESFDRPDARRIFVWILSLDAPGGGEDKPSDVPEPDGNPEEGN